MLIREKSPLVLAPRNKEQLVKFPAAGKILHGSQGLHWETLDDLQRAEEQMRARTRALQAKNLELEAYAHMVAHDLKDPLTALIVTSDLLTDVPDLSDEELKDYLRQIKTTAYEMNSIVNNLLLFAELSKGEAPLGEVDMALVVTHVLERLNHLIKKSEARIKLPKTWPKSVGYAPWIEEVWANYLSNAIKHASAKPSIQLGACVQADRMVRFWVSDDGPGISRSARNRLFRPLNQLNHVRNPNRGMGLSIAYHIVEKLGGKVGAESEPGKGSLFFFTLPAWRPSRGRVLVPASETSLETSLPG